MKPSSKMSAPSRGMKHSSRLSPSGDAGGAASPETRLGPLARVTHSPGKWPSPEGPFLGLVRDQEETPVGVGELCPILTGRSWRGDPRSPGSGVQGCFCEVPIPGTSNQSGGGSQVPQVPEPLQTPKWPWTAGSSLQPSAREPPPAPAAGPSASSI